MSEQKYTVTRDVEKLTTKHAKSVNIFKNVFAYPLPSTGSSIDPLTALPKHIDTFSARYCRDINYTAWNSQSHSMIVSFGATLGARAESRVEKPLPKYTIIPMHLIPPFMATSKAKELSSLARLRISSGEWFYTVAGEILPELPSGFRYCVELPDFRPKNNTPKEKTKDEEEKKTKDDETFEFVDIPHRDSIGIQRTPSVNPKNVLSTELEGAAIPLHGHSITIPVRAVDPAQVAFQTPGGQNIPKSPFYVAAEEGNIGDDKHTRQLNPTTKSDYMRDMPSVSYLLAHMENSNAPHIDTSSVLRGMCLAYPQHEDAWYVDKLDSHFVRDMKVGSRSNRILTILDWPVGEWGALQIPLLAVGLNAFGHMLKGTDRDLMSADVEINRGFTLDGMDRTYAVVPVDAHMMGSEFILEYILCFLSTEFWTGRTNNTWTTTHLGANGQEYTSRFTTTPYAHNVHIPGPNAVMLVLVENSLYARNEEFELKGHGMVHVYPGSTIDARVRVAQVVTDIGASWNERFSTANFELCASNMVRAIAYMQRAVCTDMAYPTAVSLAAELCSGLPQSPMFTTNAQHEYDDHALGGWAMEEKELCPNKHPAVVVGGMMAGMADTHAATWSQHIVGYNATSVSPCLQAASSYARMAGATAILDPNDRLQALGVAYRWRSRTPEYVASQYVCLTSHGVYRVLLVIGYIAKTDYLFNMMSAAGLQNTISMQGLVLSMALTDMLVRNDIPLRLWMGVDQPATAGQSGKMTELVTSVTFRYIKARSIYSFWDHAKVDPGDPRSPTWRAAIFLRLGMTITDARMFTHIPISVPAWLQWTRKVDTDIELKFTSDYGLISVGYEDRHVTTSAEECTSRPLVHCTLNVHRKAPKTFAGFAYIAPVGIPLCVDNWVAQTSQHLDNDVDHSIFTSNVLCVSGNYTYLNSNMKGSYATVNDLMVGVKVGDDLCTTSELIFPDPPSKSFLCQEDLLGDSTTGGTPLPKCLEPRELTPPVQPPQVPTPVDRPILPTERVEEGGRLLQQADE